MKFTFTCEDKDMYDNMHTITVTFETESWPSTIDPFQNFLNGCGFIIPPTDINFSEELEGLWNARQNKRKSL